MKTLRAALAATILVSHALAAGPAAAFCGFYVAQADAKLFNKASKVVLTWHDGQMATTMASDYEGDAKTFAVVIPVPTFIERKQIGVVDMPVIDHLDAFTAPRLVQYFDPDPCPPPPAEYGTGTWTSVAAAPAPQAAAGPAQPERYKGVSVEARYDVGEYDVVILAAQESDGLVNFLTDNGYKIPDGAGAVLGSYIKQKMRFFLAKVNLDRMELLGQHFLRPLQVRYESKKFMLPLRLGTVNAAGPQDLIVYALTEKGRVETTNYRTLALASEKQIPLFVANDFGNFYKATFERAFQRSDKSSVFLEYAWDVGFCDPCAAPSMTRKELVDLGVRWIEDEAPVPYTSWNRQSSVYVTRLHVRYDAEHFPEDLAFMETPNRATFQGRYVMQHPWTKDAECAAGTSYFNSLPGRFAIEADNLADLTGWPLADIRAKMEANGQSFTSRALRANPLSREGAATDR